MSNKDYPMVPPNQEYEDTYTQGYGQQGAGPVPQQPRQAVINMPSAAQLGGPQPTPFVRFPFYPTAPFYSTNPNVGYQVRFYSGGMTTGDTDYTLNSESIRIIQFDIPCRLIAINGAAVDTTNLNGANCLTEANMNQQYLFRMEYTTGDKLMTAARIASTVLGTQSNPGEIGGHGYTIDQGASVILGLTPLADNLRIDITLVCLEMRGPRNFSR
jgi:hypothetical protein